ncbi:alkylated DNA repair protein ALKBH6 homolog [Primulina eburnea]|uniref:alkylated DNA repair protein ALKBH6 homolog n=1 Tax=Primulina eburnea TaxID=1245227 RepID=UPI003C6CC3F3
MDVETSALEEFVVGSVPTVFYLPDYVTIAEEEQLLNNIYKAPISKWRTLKNRRLQNWGGIVHDKGLLAQGCSHFSFQYIYTLQPLFLI